MAFVHGKNTVFSIDDSGGTLRNLSAYLDSIDFPQTVETADVTTFGDAAKEYIVGLKDSTISISGSYDPGATCDGYLAGIVGGAAGTFEYGPQGSTGGFVKYTGEAILTSYQITGSVGDKVTFSAEFQVTGAVTRTTY